MCKQMKQYSYLRQETLHLPCIFLSITVTVHFQYTNDWGLDQCRYGLV